MSKLRNYFRGWFASGEPWIWLNAAAVGISVTAVVGILGLIAFKGFAHFWPSDVAHIQFTDANGNAQQVYGELIELDSIPVQQFLEAGGNPQWVPDNAEFMDRWLVKTGNRRVSPPDFRWLFEAQITAMDTPPGVVVLERIEWGNAYGMVSSLQINAHAREAEEAKQTVTGETLPQTLANRVDRANNVRTQIDALEKGALNHINYQLERLRLERRQVVSGNTPQNGRLEEIDAEVAALQADYEVREAELRELYERLDRDLVVLTDAAGRDISINIADVLHLWFPNNMTTLQKSGHYATAIWRFLSEDPREANTEGGIFPAIFGTILMVLLMSILVTPFGVIAALYLREYARQGVFVRVIRIAVNNLAGVPSIVYGVFGLGFFVYFLGGNIDALFYPEALPAPTFGTPGLVWASLTLALLTVPVVIVSTEEGLTRIPRSLREGSLALGATKSETLFRIILPMASPAILTGVILAVARAAGEVAPLMLVGVVKLAPTLPLDGNFPYLHLERKFMHLGFHIYDVGFQSPNVEAARPLVYATALLLVIIIVALNLTAITLRSRLEQRYRGVES